MLAAILTTYSSLGADILATTAQGTVVGETDVVMPNGGEFLVSIWKVRAPSSLPLINTAVTAAALPPSLFSSGHPLWERWRNERQGEALGSARRRGGVRQWRCAPSQRMA